MGQPQTMTVGNGGTARRIAWRGTAAMGAGAEMPGVFWLAGFNSTMVSTKATFLDDWALRHGRAFTRFDYSGTGESRNRFEDGAIGRWLEESLAVFLACTQGPQIIVGSSMGGWLALLLARALGENDRQRLAGMVLIAPAVDFTEDLMWARFAPETQREIMQKGVWRRPSPYGDAPYPITRALIEDGRRHLLFGSAIKTGCPVHILQGMADPDVPWRHALKLVEHLSGDPVTLTLVKDGDHRLSTPQDIIRLTDAVAAMATG